MQLNDRVQPIERTWNPGRPVPLGAIIGWLRKGPADPTYRIDEHGAHWRGIRTPEGTTTLRLISDEGGAHAQAWGEGADWIIDRVPRLLGADDDPTGFEPRHPVLVDAARRFANWRLCSTDLVSEALVPAIIEQKVTGQEAYRGFRDLVHFFGERAPGPGENLKLWVQPAPQTIRTIPSWDWLRMHIDPARSRALMQAMRAIRNLQTAADRRDSAQLDQRLRSLPGMGVWTSAEVRSRVLGDADAVSFGDYHIAKNIGWALSGEEFDDDQLAEFLEPWRPHRLRVQQLVLMSGAQRPRRGPRMAPRTHLPAP